MKQLFFLLLLIGISGPSFSDEAPLQPLASDRSREIYRFSWDRSFDDKLVYTVDLTSPEKPILVIHRYTREKPKQAPSESAVTLSPVQVENLRSFLTGAQFWTLPHQREDGGLDGATWRLEGVKEGKYHYTIRWSPLPPYYGWQGTLEKGKLVMRRLNPPFMDQVKHSDEVGLDMLCLYIMLMTNQEPELIY